MDSLRTLANLCIIALCLCLLFSLIKLIRKTWWTPIHIQSLLNSQGIKGPSYKFIYGNSKEIRKMRAGANQRPLENFSHDICSRISPHVHSWTNKYGKNCLFWVGTRGTLVVSEPELIREVLNNREKVYLKPDQTYFSEKLLGNGIVTSEGETWFHKRKLANYAFHSESLKNMIPSMIASVEMMLERWKTREGLEIEVFQEFKLLTSEVISRTAFGSSYLEGKSIFEMLQKLATLIQKNAFKFRLPGLSEVFRNQDEIEAEKLEKGIKGSILELAYKREKTVRSGQVKDFGSDFLGLLVKARNDEDESKRMTVDDLVDECKTFYFAGQETTNVLLAWTTCLLAINREWQEKARAEVVEVFGEKTPNADGITKLKVINMIINETLRLYPPIVGLTRKVTRKVHLGNLALPANINLLLPTIALLHDPIYWGEDVHSFKPERFSEGVSKFAKHYLPFGSGPRSCVGNSFAMVEAKIALSMILQRYTFKLSPGYVHSPISFITIRPEHGIQITLEASKE